MCYVFSKVRYTTNYLIFESKERYMSHESQGVFALYIGGFSPFENGKNPVACYPKNGHF